MIAPLVADEQDVDALLMERVRDGEPELFGEIVRRNQTRVAGLIYRMQPHGGEVEDLTQRVFTQAFRARHGYRPTAKFSTWLFVITKNVVLNQRRHAARRRQVELSLIEHGTASGLTSTDNPVAEAIQAETQATVRQAIDMLGDRQRRAVQLIFLQGFRYRAAGEELNLSEKAVKSLVHRAKGNLRAHLRDCLPELDGIERQRS